MRFCRFLLVFILVIFIFSFFIQKGLFSPSNKIVNLSQKAEWKFRERGKIGWFKAKVPGSVQLNLLNLGLIPDPYYRDNEEKVQWVGKKDWDYKGIFYIKKEWIKRYSNFKIVFKGIDTYATVFLNGKKLFRADNFFRLWEADVKDLLVSGKNFVFIKFQSPLKLDREKARKYPFKKTTSEYMFTRKPAYHYGWDWGPRILTQGLWDDVYILMWKECYLKDFQIYQVRLTKKLAVLRLDFEIVTDRDMIATVVLESKALKNRIKYKFSLKKGINLKKVFWEIKSPKLWWIHELGQPNLYDFKAKLIYRNGIKGIIKRDYGIRKIELVRKKDSMGETFYFKLNGIPVFIKGANYIPQDIFIERVKESRYRKLLKDSIKANINMLRVWGGGFYEKDIFYKLCDELGILVWQDFMFACSLYPGNREFLKNVKEEAIYNVKRLRNHPSISLWCGNNENYIGWEEWGWSKMFHKNERDKVFDDYKKLFEKLLPSVVKKYDPERAYWPSSPKHGGKYPLRTDGDVHYWGVWHGEEPFSSFEEEKNIGRFMSEYGFQGMPVFKTIEEFTLPQDWDIESKVMRVHQKHRIGYPVITKYMNWYYRKPRTFFEHVYKSQLLQADGIKLAIEAHRRAKPFCMGTMYWQLNDCWPVVSWSGIDWFSRWKALHYFVKKAFSPIIVSIKEANNMINVYIVSDRNSDFKGKLKIKLIDFEGRSFFEKTADVFVKKNSSKIYFKMDLQLLLRGIDKRKSVFVVKLLNEGKVLYESLYYFVSPKELLLKEPLIKMAIYRLDDKLHIKLLSDTLVKNVYLRFKNRYFKLSDNFFDLLPGKIKDIVIEDDEVLSEIEILNELDVLSLNTFRGK